MSHFIILLTRPLQKFKEDMLNEMKSRFPTHKFISSISGDDFGDGVIPMQGGAGSMSKPGRLRPVDDTLLRQIRIEFALALKKAQDEQVQ